MSNEAGSIRANPYAEGTATATERLEVIRVRAHGQALAAAVARLMAELAQIRHGDPRVDVRIYRHAAHDDELLIELHHGRGAAPPTGLGLHIVDALRQHGATHHSVWVQHPPPASGS
jgi:hypothetical protein